VFSARTEADEVDRDLFSGWERQHRNFRFTRTLTREPGEPPLGRVPELLPTLFPDLSDHDLFIAGAPGFVAAASQAARRLGACSVRMHTEEFFVEPRPWAASTTPVAP